MRKIGSHPSNPHKSELSKNNPQKPSLQINQLKIISKVSSSDTSTNNGNDAYLIKKEEKEEIIQECLDRVIKYLERLEEA